MAAHIFEFAGGPKYVPFTVRLVTKGMGFGLWDRGGDGWALVHESEKPVIEFFDRRFSMTPHGQFISRYFLETLQQGSEDSRQRASGLMLDTGSPDWQIGAESLEGILQTFVPVAHARAAQLAQGLVLTLSNRGNPDHSQDPTFPIFSAPDDMKLPVSDLQEASALSRLYIDAFGLGGGNWTGGQVEDGQGRPVARVAYNGRVFGPDDALMEESADTAEYPLRNFEWFFEQAPAESVVEASQVERGQRQTS